MLRTTYDYMDALKRVMDSSTREQMDNLYQRHDGFYRFAKLLEAMAQGTADSVIDVPKDH